MKSVYFWQRIITPHMALLADALAKQGVGVVYVANNEISDDRMQQGWQPPTLQYARLRIALDKTAVIKVVECAPTDSIHLCQGLRGNGLVQIAQQQIRNRGLLQWVIMETVDDSGMRGILKRIVYRILIWRQRHHIEGILAIGEKTGSWIAAHGFQASRIFSFAYFLQNTALPCSLGGAPHDHFHARFQFLFVGQLIERKRVSDLISALANLGRSDVMLTIVGNGPLENLLREKSKMCLPGRVRFLGVQPMSEIQALMARSDCLVLPSRHDGWGAVVSEALIVGTPVVCSDTCGASIAVRASGAGAVFPANDLAAFQEALGTQLDRDRWKLEERARLSAWAKCLSADAGALYLQQIFGCVEHGGERPLPTWENN